MQDLPPGYSVWGLRQERVIQAYGHGHDKVCMHGLTCLQEELSMVGTQRAALGDVHRLHMRWLPPTSGRASFAMCTNGYGRHANPSSPHFELSSDSKHQQTCTCLRVRICTSMQSHKTHRHTQPCFGLATWTCRPTTACVHIGLPKANHLRCKRKVHATQATGSRSPRQPQPAQRCSAG